MSSMTSSLTESDPRLPYELIVLIIHEAWLSHNITLRERMDMFTSFSLVSLDFAWEFTRVYTSHVHIFNHAHYKHYIRAFHNDTDFLQIMRKVGRCLDARTSCQSITTHCLSNPDDPELDIDLSDALVDVVCLTIPVEFPSVHHFGIVYHDWTVQDGNLPYLSLPKQVDVLEVTQVMSAKLASHNREEDFKLSTLPRLWRYSKAKTELSYIQRLEVYGGNTALMAGLMKACPNARAVLHNGHSYRGITSRE